MRRIALCQDGFIIGSCTDRKRVIEFDRAFLIEQNSLGGECLVSDILSLEMTEGNDAAASNRPNFLLLEFPLLEIPLVDLIIKRPVFPLIEGLNFEMRGAELILRM